MATIPSTPRSTAFTVSTTSAGPFNVGFRLLESDALAVFVDGDERSDFAVSATYTAGYTDAATITFTASIPAGSDVLIDGGTVPRRQYDYLNGDPQLTSKMNIELARIWAAISEVTMQVGRGLRVLGTSVSPLVFSFGQIPMWDGTEFVASDIPSAIAVVEPLVVNVPDDYDTTTDALNAVQGYRAYFNADITILHAAGYEIPAPVFFDGADFRGVRLASANTAPGSVTTDGVGIIPVTDDFPLDRDVFYFRDCVTPRFDFVLDCQTRGRNGIFAEGGRLNIRHRCGVINAGINGGGDAGDNDFAGDGDAILTGCGIVSKGATLYCESRKVAGVEKGLVAQGNARVGVWATYGTMASIPHSQLQDNGSDPGLDAEHGGIGISRGSIVMMDYSVFSGSVRGIRSARSWVSARLSVFDDVNGEAIRVFEGGRVFAARSSFVNAGRASATVSGVLTHYPILAAYGSSETRPQGGGEIIAESSDFTGAKSEIAVALGASSLIVLDDSTATDIDNRVARVGGTSTVIASRLSDGAGGPVIPSASNTAAELVLISDGSLFQGQGPMLDGDSRITYGIRTKETGRADVRGAVMSNFATTFQVDNPETGSRIYASDAMVNGALHYPVVIGEPVSLPAPYLLRGDAAYDDTAQLNAWLAGGGTIRPLLSHTYRVTGAVTIPDGAFIDGELRLVYDGPNDLAWLTIGDDVYLDSLQIDIPTATGMTASIGTGYRGQEIRMTGGGNAGATALTIANTAGLDLGRFESVGGFQRPLALGNPAAWSTGGRIGEVVIRDYTRGLAINYLDGFTLGTYDIGGRNSAASYTAGHNGILAAGLRNCTFGAGRIEGAGEHLFRLGGTAAMGASYNNTFGDMVLDGPGGSFVKINADAVAYDFRFGDIAAVGRFATAPGGNRELLRLSHCRSFTFGAVSLTLGDGATYSAQDAVAANDTHDIHIASIHADALNQSVFDALSGQDNGDGLGNGDVYNIHVGGLTGTNSYSKSVVRVALDTGFTARNITIAGMDYFTDGVLFNASGTTVIDGPCSISGRLRRTDLTALPAVSSLPGAVAVDLTVGEMPVVAFNGALVDARAITQPYADRAAMIAALAATPAGVTRIGHYTTGGSVLFYRRSAGATVISDMAGWVYESGTLDQDLTVQVPGNYPSLQAAFNALSVLRSHGAVIAVNIQAGHQLAAGLLLQNGDFSHFRITSSYTPVTLAAGFVGVTLPGVVDQNVNTVITVSNARGPNIACVIDMGGVLGTGLFVTLNSTVGVDPSCGIINAGYYGASVASTSALNADNAVFYECDWGNRVTTSSNASFRKADLHGGCGGDLEAACLVVSRGSYADVRGDPGDETNLTGSARNGLYVRRSFVSADWCDCSNSGATGFLASNGAYIAANFAIASGSAIGFSCIYGHMHAANSVATGCTDRAYYAEDGGWLNAYGADGSGSTGAYGARASDGGTIIGADGNFAKAVSDTDDISVSGGGFINANNATGQLSISDNLPGASGFIMGGSTRQSPKTTDNITIAKVTSSGTAPELAMNETDTTTLARVLLSGGNLNIQAQASGGGSNAGIILISGYNGADATRIETRGPVRQPGVTFASLPAAGTVGAGTRHMITDSSVSTFGSVAAGGGSTLIPVYSDGTNWRVG